MKIKLDRKHKILSLLGAQVLLLIGTFVVSTVTWFSCANSYNVDVHSSIRSLEDYFGNDGTNYWLISSPQHMKNLSYLYTYGTDADIQILNRQTFTVTQDINMNSESCFPIGTENRPFGGTIVTKNSSSYTFTNYVVNGSGYNDIGVFGYTDGSSISNIVFDNLTLDVGQNSDAVDAVDIGYLIGHVHGECIFNNFYCKSANFQNPNYVGLRSDFGYVGRDDSNTLDQESFEDKTYKMNCAQLYTTFSEKWDEMKGSPAVTRDNPETKTSRNNGMIHDSDNNWALKKDGNNKYIMGSGETLSDIGYKPTQTHQIGYGDNPGTTTLPSNATPYQDGDGYWKFDATGTGVTTDGYYLGFNSGLYLTVNSVSGSSTLRLDYSLNNGSVFVFNDSSDQLIRSIDYRAINNVKIYYPDRGVYLLQNTPTFAKISGSKPTFNLSEGRYKKISYSYFDDETSTTVTKYLSLNTSNIFEYTENSEDATEFDFLSSLSPKDAIKFEEKYAKDATIASSPVTFSYSNYSGQGTSGTGSNISATLDGITISSDKGYQTSTHVRIYAGGKITINPGINTITNIVITCTSSGYASALANPSTGSLSCSGSNCTWKGTAKSSFTIDANSQSRWSSIVVTYSAGSVVDVTGVSLNKENTSIEIGSEETLTATITPTDATNKNISWSSSDGSKATVDQNGTVKGVAVGSAIITVTTEDGNYTASCNVTVNPSTDKLYEKVNTISEGEFVFVGNGTNAMKAAISSSRAENGTATINNNFVKNPDDMIVWTIQKIGNYYSFYNAKTKKYLSATSSNNQASLVDNTSDDKAKWNLLSSGDEFNFQNVGRSGVSNSYLRNNGTYGWAAYASATGNKPKLYKKINEKTLSSIDIQTPPTKTSYIDNDKFDPTGLVITCTYSDNTTSDVSYAEHSSDFTFDPSLNTALTSTNKSVTITYGGKTTTQEITVTPYVAFISVKTPPSKVQYNYKEKFNPTGLVLNIIYSSGPPSEVPYNTTTASSFSFNPGLNTELTSSDNITITYGGKTCTQAYTVSKVLSSIAIKTAPNNTSYVVNDHFDPTGLVITATYVGGGSDDISYNTQATQSRFSFNPDTSVSLQTTHTKVVVSYTEDSVTKTANQAITVAAGKTLTSVSISAPTTNIYNHQTLQLTANVVFEGISETSLSYVWTSRDTEKATVDSNGLVTGISGGTARVYVTVSSTEVSNTVTSEDFVVTVTQYSSSAGTYSYQSDDTYTIMKNMGTEGSPDWVAMNDQNYSEWGIPHFDKTESTVSSFDKSAVGTYVFDFAAKSSDLCSRYDSDKSAIESRYGGQAAKMNNTQIMNFMNDSCTDSSAISSVTLPSSDDSFFWASFTNNDLNSHKVPQAAMKMASNSNKAEMTFKVNGDANINSVEIFGYFWKEGTQTLVVNGVPNTYEAKLDSTGNLMELSDLTFTLSDSTNEFTIEAYAGQRFCMTKMILKTAAPIPDSKFFVDQVSDAANYNNYDSSGNWQSANIDIVGNVEFNENYVGIPTKNTSRTSTAFSVGSKFTPATYVRGAFVVYVPANNTHDLGTIKIKHGQNIPNVLRSDGSLVEAANKGQAGDLSGYSYLTLNDTNIGNFALCALDSSRNITTTSENIAYYVVAIGGYSSSSFVSIYDIEFSSLSTNNNTTTHRSNFGFYNSNQVSSVPSFEFSISEVGFSSNCRSISVEYDNTDGANAYVLTYRSKAGYGFYLAIRNFDTTGQCLGFKKYGTVSIEYIRNAATYST